MMRQETFWNNEDNKKEGNSFLFLLKKEHLFGIMYVEFEL